MGKAIFVFGSNLAGRHGTGAALHAKIYYRAKQGIGVGRTGDAYAIPTKDKDLRVLPLDEIREHIKNFGLYVDTYPYHYFIITEIGTGLAGYTLREIAPMFKEFIDKPNVFLPSRFVKTLLDLKLI